MLPAIGLEPISSGPLCPLEVMVAITTMVVERYAESAGSLHLVDFRDDQLSRAGIDRALGSEALPFRLIRQNGMPASVQPENQRRTVEGAEHESDPAVLEQMRGRFVSGTRQVRIRHTVRSVEPCKRLSHLTSNAIAGADEKDRGLGHTWQWYRIAQSRNGSRAG